MNHCFKKHDSDLSSIIILYYKFRITIHKKKLHHNRITIFFYKYQIKLKYLKNHRQPAKLESNMHKTSLNDICKTQVCFVPISKSF